jgi:hypothetical protein
MTSASTTALQGDYPSVPPANPKQVDGLDLTPVDDGFTIYESAKNRVHYLNHTAALVLILCDGRNSEDDIRALLQRRFQLPAPPDQDVAQILAQFLDEGLVIPAERPAVVA